MIILGLLVSSVKSYCDLCTKIMRSHMKVIRYPKREEWADLLQRPTSDDSAALESAKTVLDRVRAEGDAAVLHYTSLFDKAEVKDLAASETEFEQAELAVSDDLKAAIDVAIVNITKFHSAQEFKPLSVEISEGILCQQRALPIEKVGLYVPGGTAPLFSTVLMLAIPAKIAGCKEIILCTPPNPQGEIHPAILYAAKKVGVSKVYKTGGIQAVGAMAYGTESIPKVNKIFGPGNQYVTAAKQIVSLNDVAIDMPAGPSEVEVIADATAHPDFVAADLLSQAEHGATSQVILVTDDESIIPSIQEELRIQLAALPRKEMAQKAVDNSKIIVVQADEIMPITNMYAPEHLIISTKNYQQQAEQVENAGSVFLGHYTPESAGDYASGTNHTLPTNGYAMMYSGVNLDSFTKKITFQELTREGIMSIGKEIELMAEAEELFAHKNAVTLRMK